MRMIEKKEKGTGGQATIELLLVLSVLLVLLAVSLNIFWNQQQISNQREADYALVRNAQRLAHALTHMSVSPIGTKTVLFLPPSPVSQTFYIRNGLVEGFSGPSGIGIAIPSRAWYYSGTLSDGNRVTLTRDWNTVTIQAGSG